MISIAIDGPSGAGKSSLARSLAEQLGYLYVDTGALYRTIGLAVLRAGKNPANEEDVAAQLPGIRFVLRHVNGVQRVFLDDEDVSEAIRAEDVSMAASAVSAHVPVREFLLETQRRLAREHNVIMDGRDIGTVVLPDADVKIFLTASVDERARRRHRQLVDAGAAADFETVKRDVVRRDEADSTRAAAPLKKAADAVELDTTGLTYGESLDRMLEIIRGKAPGEDDKPPPVPPRMKTLRRVYLVLYHMVFWFAMVVVRLVVPIRTIGRANIPKGRGFVLAPNHIRSIDPMYVMLARGGGKKMLVMAKDELFHINPAINFFWNVAGGFPIERGTGNRTVIDQVAREVQKGRGLLIFPEGTRTKDGNLGRLKSGAFVVMMQAGVDMVPCRVWYKAGRPKAFHRTTIVFGRPVSMAELGLVGEYNASKLREAKKRYAQLLEELYEENKHRL